MDFDKLEISGKVAGRGKNVPSSISGQVLLKPSKEYQVNANDPEWDNYYAKLWQKGPPQFIIIIPKIELEFLYLCGPAILAIVTEVGGITAHGCIVVRELIEREMKSLQALIVGAEGAYSCLKNDDLIEIIFDKNTATIRRTSSP